MQFVLIFLKKTTTSEMLQVYLSSLKVSQILDLVIYIGVSNCNKRKSCLKAIRT